MVDLMRAGFARMWRNKLFYLLAGCVLLLAVGTMLGFGRQALADTSDYVYRLEQHYYDTGVYMGIFLSAFVALFIGTEYADGTLRNKLVVGQRRADVYLSNLAVCAVAALVFTAAWLVGGLAGVPALGFWSVGTKAAVMTVVVSVLAAVSLSSIFLLVSMLSANRAVTAIASVFLSLLLIVAASYFYNHLCEPEMSSGVTITMEGGLQMMDPTPNPRYVAEPLRTVYGVIVNALPTGQVILAANVASGEGFASYPLQIAADILLTALTTGVGVCLFKRKDIK